MDNIKRLAKKLLQHKGDMPLATLDATLELQDSIEELKEAIENIPETVIPEHPTEMEVTMKGISVVTLKGEKGDSPTEEELVSLIKPLIPEPIPGKKGDKGDTMVVEKVIERIETIIEQPIITNEVKEVAVTDTAEVIVSKVNELPTNDDTLKIDASHIKNLPEFKNGNYYGGSGIKEIVAGSGITVDNTNQNYPTISASNGSGSPLTTKGDLYTYSTTNTRLPIGINGQVLIADDAEDTGMKWDYPESTGIRIYMFANVASDIATYYDAVSLPIYTTGSEGSISTAGVSTTPTLLGSFATELGYPGTTNVPIGTFQMHYETQKVAGSNNYYSFARIYKRSSGGTETLLLTSDHSTQTASNTRFQATVSAVSSDLIVLDPTDRIVVKVYGVMLSSTATIGLYFDDATDARLEMPASNVDVSNFVPYTGATADVNLGSNDLLVEDEAYGAGWNGSLEVPTKNAVYDKIQSLSSGVTRSISSISSPTTAGATASTDYVYLVSGTTTITLPTAVGNTNQYTIKCVSGTTTIATTSAQTIDGSASAVLSVANTSLTLVSDNSNWNII